MIKKQLNNYFACRVLFRKDPYSQNVIFQQGKISEVWRNETFCEIRYFCASKMARTPLYSMGRIISTLLILNLALFFFQFHPTQRDRNKKTKHFFKSANQNSFMELARKTQVNSSWFALVHFFCLQFCLFKLWETYIRAKICLIST